MKKARTYKAFLSIFGMSQFDNIVVIVLVFKVKRDLSWIQSDYRLYVSGKERDE